MTNANLILARAKAFALETDHHAAQRRHTATKSLYRRWVAAKARLCALEVRA